MIYQVRLVDCDDLLDEYSSREEAEESIYIREKNDRYYGDFVKESYKIVEIEEEE